MHEDLDPLMSIITRYVDIARNNHIDLIKTMLTECNNAGYTSTQSDIAVLAIEKAVFIPIFLAIMSLLEEPKAPKMLQILTTAMELHKKTIV